MNDRLRGWGVAVFLVLAPMAASAAGREHQGRLSVRAQEAARARGTAKLDVLVRFRQVPGEPERSLVQGLGGRVQHSLKPSSRWMALRVPAQRLAALANSDAV